MKVTKLRAQSLVLLAAISFSGYTNSQIKNENPQSTKIGPVRGEESRPPLGQSAISHLLMEQIILTSHVRHRVRLFGDADDDRDASASSDEGTPTLFRFFQVEQVASDSGSCTG